jgi:hypothetical protein
MKIAIKLQNIFIKKKLFIEIYYMKLLIQIFI